MGDGWTSMGQGSTKGPPSRPPYIPADDWKKYAAHQRREIMDDVRSDVKKYDALKERISILERILEEYRSREGVRIIRDTPGRYRARGIGGAPGSGDAAPAMSVPRCAHVLVPDTGILPSMEVAMPTVVVTANERGLVRPLPHEMVSIACTARDVGRKERSENVDAKAALKKEWDRLRACGERVLG